ncbi:MAG TPA: hypothetical protein VMB53_00870 [Gaiellaceae bacterium]|nr:hypothetical protein [Gaiellaceae bacterium]
MDARKAALAALADAEADRKSLAQHHAALHEAGVELASLAARLMDELGESAMSFNLQYLQLQSQLQAENRAYTAVSNIMKTKHDTVKNSISNIR